MTSDQIIELTASYANDTKPGALVRLIERVRNMTLDEGAKLCYEVSGVEEDEDDEYRTDGWTQCGKECAEKIRSLKHRREDDELDRGHHEARD